MLPNMSRGEIDADESVQHTLDISVDYGYGLGKRDAGDGGGGVASDAGQREQGFGIPREGAAVFPGNLPRGLMQHARAPGVAQTAPGCQHGVFGSCGERLDIRKAFEENPVVVKDGGHARLLQHNFAEPDAIGIASFAPRKVAAMLIVPAQQGAPDMNEILGRNGGVDQGGGRGGSRRGQPRLYGEGSRRGHHYWVTLCAMTTHPFFCCCQTVIMCCGVEGSGCEPAAPFPAAPLMVPFRVMV